MLNIFYKVVISYLWFGIVDCSSNDVWIHRNSEVNVQVTKNSWWGASQTGCEEFGGQLYVPRSLDISQDVAAILDPGSYWIGAMSYSSWKWTYDNTPLYVHTGYIQSNRSSTAGVEIDGITVFLCHLHCGEDYTQFGLQGSRCYCLWRDGSELPPREEIRCDGIYEEWCGDENGMSVYEIADINMTPESDGQCVYAEKISFYTTFKQDDSCSSERSLAFSKTSTYMRRWNVRCKGKICVNHSSRSWDESEATHKLLKVTDLNEDDLYQAMYKGFTYWIGLRRIYRQIWINGSDVNMNSDCSTDPQCLCVGKSRRGKITFSWRQCSERLKAICQTVASTTTGPTTTPMTSSPSTLSPPTSVTTNTVTTVPQTPGPQTPSSGSSTTTPSDWTTATSPTATGAVAMPSTRQEHANVGTTVGVVIFVIIILALVVVSIFIMKRKQLLFFKPEQTEIKVGDGIPVSAMENKTYSNIPEPDDHIYAIPFPQAEYAELSEAGRPSDISSTSAETSHVLINPYMNGLVPSTDADYNFMSGNQAVTVPTSLHAYDHISGVEKMVSMESRPEGNPQTVQTLVDDYDHCETNGVQKIHSENEYQSLDDIDQTFLEANTYELAQSFDDAQPSVEDSSGRHGNDSSVVTTDRWNINNPAGDVGESTYSNIASTTFTGVVRDHEPCYYNTAYSSDDPNKNNEDDKPDQETKNRIHASEA